MRMRFGFILKPYSIVLLTSFFSFCFWLFPSFNGNFRKGFREYFDVSGSGILLCCSWLAFICLMSYAGFGLGWKLKITTTIADRRANIDDYKPYFLVSLLGASGILYVLFRLIIALGFSGMISALVLGNANQLKDTLYSNYSIGLASLRYMTIPAAALGFYHFFARRYIITNIFNIFALGLVAIISSRLSIIYTVFILICLLLSRRHVSIKFRYIFLALAILFNLMCALNYTRNINFYRSIGINNFYAAGFSEIVTYLGSPFQGFLASGTYADQLYGKTIEITQIKAGIEPQLNTNSAFIDLIREYGVIFAFVIIGVYAFFGGMIMSISYRNRNNLLIILMGVVGYCFAEIWRVFLFDQGIVATIFILIIATMIYCIVFPSSRIILTNRIMPMKAGRLSRRRRFIRR